MFSTMDKIKFTWREKKLNLKKFRVGAMYYFSRCDVNVN